MPAFLSFPESEPAWVIPLMRRLLIVDLRAQLPGIPLTEFETFTQDEARRLLGRASVLSLTDSPQEQLLAYEIATRLIEVFENKIPGLVAAADVILSRIGNFPGRSLLRLRYNAPALTPPDAPARLSLERIGRELENSVTGPDGQSLFLTDFQYEFLEALRSNTSVSVSAPTSAGKSFVLGLDLADRLMKVVPACVVYVVPTRALIREVSLLVRKNLRQANMDRVPVRSVPFPISREDAPAGAVFVLTQERLMSLLHSSDGEQWITSIIVDEAQSIQDGARGVILQAAIKSALTRNPNAEIHFASPLASNPEFLLETVNRRQFGATLLGEISPVAQNLILISEVYKKPLRARFDLLGDNEPIDLGIRQLDFRLRDGTYAQRAALAKAVTREDECTLLYGNDPHATEQLASALTDGEGVPEVIDPEISELIDFIRAEIHQEYPLINCLPHGVAYHYGYMPAIVRARIEDLCRSGKIKYVCCTSTLLQGVNLPARHIIIENPKRGNTDAMSRADFLNLAGRAGRLLREFHGNVWCIRPLNWDKKAYEGEPLTEIRSAMNEAMADGGTIVQKVLSNQATEKELDYGEAALGILYCDFVRGNQDLGQSQWRTDANAEALTETSRMINRMNVTLPTDVLDANRAVRPDRMQALYERLSEEPEPTSLVPLRPGVQESNDRMRVIIQIVQEELGGVDNNSYQFYSWLAAKWIHNTPLSSIIAQRLAYQRQRDNNQAIAPFIRELLQALETVIRFRLVKYYRAYVSILELVLREKGEADAASELEQFHVFLECGASDRIALNLIALGLSRNTALALRNAIQFPDEANPEQCLAQLAVLNLAELNIPGLCSREIRELLGR